MAKTGRKLYLVNPAFQLRFLAFMLVLIFVSIAIFYAANKYFFSQFYAEGVKAGLEPSHVFFVFLHEQEKFMDTVFGVTSVVLFVCLTLAGILFSHRIAGPLYKFRRHMDDLAGGSINDDQVLFRKGDFFQELASSFNELMKQRRKGR